MILIVCKDSRYRIETGTSVAVTTLHIMKSANEVFTSECGFMPNRFDGQR